MFVPLLFYWRTCIAYTDLQLQSKNKPSAHTHMLTCSVCLLSLECSSADTVATDTPDLTSEGTKELAS